MSDLATTSLTISDEPVRRLLLVLAVAAAAVLRTSSGVLTQTDCETVDGNGSRSYHACVAGPEHILRPGIATGFNVTVDPPNSTCGLTPQISCTLVRIHRVK